MPLGPQPSKNRGDNHSPRPCSSQKFPSKARLLASQSKSIRSIAHNMEERTIEKEALFSLKMDIEMEKTKATKITNLKHKGLGGDC